MVVDDNAHDAVLLKRHNPVMAGVPPEVVSYYEAGREIGRLADGGLAGPLELARTRELLTAVLPPAPADVLDVGGGPGVYARWLSDNGYSVQLIDVVPLHVQTAQQMGLTASVGDARALDQAPSSVDVVLLMGPLYHLPDAVDRRSALREAWRVLRPGGLLVATAISRHAALLDLLVRLDRLHEPNVMNTVVGAVQTGVFHGSPDGLFTTAFFHLPRQLRQEIGDAGFHTPTVKSIEGPGFLASDFDARWSDPDRREAMLIAARLVESEPEALAASSHLFAVATKPIGGA